MADEQEKLGEGTAMPDSPAPAASGADAAPNGKNTIAEQAEQPQPTEEEIEQERRRRERAEHNALADVFDDVRRASRDGALVTPDRWEEQGFVPEHMSPEEFEMFVFEYLEQYLEEHRHELEDERAAAKAKAARVHSASRIGVGVPPKIPHRRLAQIEADEEAGRTVTMPVLGGPAQEDAASAAAPAPEAAAPGVDEAPAAPTVPEAAPASPAPADDDRSPFEGLRIPDGYKLVELEGEYVLVPESDDELPPERTIDCRHVVALVGEQSYYLYDTDNMTDRFAHWCFMAAEDNPLATFVDCVREEGRIYPRPLAESDLHNPPFRMSADDVERTWHEVQASGSYPDIERTEASNGDVYFYSTLYLEPAYATSLAEWISVERPRNV